MSFSYRRTYRGPIEAVLLDWAGTTMDFGCMAPAVVFVQVYERQKVPITMDEARAPMGAHKKVHIQKISQLDSVRRRWQEVRGRPPNDDDVNAMFAEFVPLQLACLSQYSRLIPGTLEVVAYRNGAQWATDAVKTAGPPQQLEARPDRAVIRADGRDLAFVTVRVADASGVTAPRADNVIRFAVEGPGEIVATDNGDPTSFVPFYSHERRAFNGLCLVIVRAKRGQAGPIVLTASSDGLRMGTTVITATSGGA